MASWLSNYVHMPTTAEAWACTVQVAALLQSSVLPLQLAPLFFLTVTTGVLSQPVWVTELVQQVTGALYIAADGANTSQLTQGYAIDPLPEDEAAVLAAVLVAKDGELWIAQPCVYARYPRQRHSSAQVQTQQFRYQRDRQLGTRRRLCLLQIAWTLSRR